MHNTTVVFDIGNVLISWDPDRLYRTLIADPDERHRFLTEVTSPQWHDQQDRGRPTAIATAQLQQQFPAHAELIAAFYGRWSEMFGGALPATVDVLRELRDGGVRLLALTNWPAEKFSDARERFPFLSWFEGIVVSGEERMAKPDEAIFRILLDRYAVDPAAALYLDDNPQHVEAASRLGMTGLQVTGVATLRRDLAAAGLPVSANVEVRPARSEDLRALTDIYNSYVTDTAATFDVEPVTVERHREWYDAHAGTGRHRLLVATTEDQVVGFATSGRFRPRPAYDTTVETTVYLRSGLDRRGIGSMLYQQLLTDLSGEDAHLAVATIALPNDASMALHRRFGFREVGVLSQVGRKFDRWWDVCWMQRPLP